VLASSAIARGGLAGGALQTKEGAYKMNLKRLSLLAAVALATVAYAAVPASADMLSPGESGSVYSDCVFGGDAQDCPVKGVDTGSATTLTMGSTVITCQGALIEGLMDGDATAANDPAEAQLNFAWADCATEEDVECVVDPINGVSFDIDEQNAPSATFISTEAAGAAITCGAIFSCTLSSNPASDPLTGEFDQATQILTFGETVTVSGSVGCPLSGTATWQAQYLITDDQDQDLDLWATGTL
jgi:hypothetical protein